MTRQRFIGILVLVKTMNVRNFKDELAVTGDSVMAISPEEKTCSKCGDTLPFETGFYDDKRTVDGKCGWCIPCKDENSKLNRARRAVKPMSARAEAMKVLYRKRFKVIEAAGLPIDEEGLGIQKKIDRILKKHGLYSGIRRAKQ